MEKSMLELANQIKPKQVLLFSGHMIDSCDRPQPRFPSGMEKEAQKKIDAVLDRLEANSEDLAIAPGIACGGDILFIESCLQRQIKTEVYLPFKPAEFIAESVSFAGDNWIERFDRIKNNPLVKIHLQPEELGLLPVSENAYERNNNWTLNSSLGYGSDRVKFIVLWDGKGGDGQGGTYDMVERVRGLGGTVIHLNTTEFDYWRREGKSF